MKVMLINPPRDVKQRADFPPLGLAYLKSALIKVGFSVCIIDASVMSWSQISREIKDFAANVVGITCWTIGRKQAFKSSELVKKILPEAKILFGGQHPSAVPNEIFTKTDADLIVMGEGDETIVEVVKCLASRKSISSIRGIAYQSNNKTIINEQRPFIKDLDSLPFPDYTDFRLEEYNGVRELKGRVAALITSRGCPHRCIFCSSSKFWKQKWRLRSAENVLDELEWLYRDYKIRIFMFFDDLFTLKKERVIAICKGIIDRGMKIRWVACTRVDTVDLEILKWMKLAGCYMIEYGVESGSSLILKNIKKNITVEKICQAFQWTHQTGILSRAYLMVGNPGETAQTIDDTINLAKIIKPYGTNSGNLVMIFPNTELYEMAKEKGIIADDYWLTNSNLMYYTAEHSLKELKALRNHLMFGLAGNRGGFLSFFEYLFKRFYFTFPIVEYIFRNWIVRHKVLIRFFRRRQLKTEMNIFNKRDYN